MGVFVIIYTAYLFNVVSLKKCECIVRLAGGLIVQSVNFFGGTEFFLLICFFPEIWVYFPFRGCTSGDVGEFSVKIE